MPVDRIQTPQKVTEEQFQPSPPPPLPPMPVQRSTFYENAPWGHQDVERRIARTTPENVVLAGTSAQSRRLEGINADRPERRPTPVTDFVRRGNVVYCSDFPSTPELEQFDLPNIPATDNDGPFHLSSASVRATSFDEESLSDQALPSAPPPTPDPATPPAVEPVPENAHRSKIAARWRSVLRGPSSNIFKRPRGPPVTDEYETLSMVTDWGSGSERSMTLDESEGAQGNEAAGDSSTEPTGPSDEGATTNGDGPAQDGPLERILTAHITTAQWLQSPGHYIQPPLITHGWIKDWALKTALYQPPVTPSEPDSSTFSNRLSTASAKLGKPLRRLLSRRSLRNSTVSTDGDSAVRDSVVISEASFGTPEEYVPRRPLAEGRRPSPLSLDQTSEDNDPSTPTIVPTPMNEQITASPRSDGTSTPTPTGPSSPTSAPTPRSSPRQALPPTPTASLRPYYLTPGPGPITHLQLEVMFATEPATYATPHASALTVNFSTTPNWVNPSPERTVESVAQVWENVRMGVAQLRGETLRLAYIPLLETEPPLTPPATGAATQESSVESDMYAEFDNVDATPRLTRRLSCRAMSTVASPSMETTPGSAEVSAARTENEGNLYFTRPWSSLSMLLEWHTPAWYTRDRKPLQLASALSVVDEADSYMSSPRSSMSTVRPSINLFRDESDDDVDQPSAEIEADDEPATPRASQQQLPAMSPGPQIRPPKPKLVLDESNPSKPLQKEPWGAITSLLDAFAQFAFEAEIADTRLVAMAHGHEPFYLATAANPAADRIVFLALLTSLATTIIDSFPRASFAGVPGARLRSILAAFVEAVNVLFEPFAETEGVIAHLNTRRISRLVNGGKKMRILGPTMRLSDFMAGVEGHADEV
ncbi:uncharacterized protein LOC62_01G000144 [Vanrija pseudolonga]|uniref:Uncharacterized protein n=1 Tax=Vanrija pseudolonga TaxID=143232 RepID=A0AAF0XYZ2_9TREE|nr:hypothetical protein LOC62_01G000144 [Vanrija pseudolonga]